MRLNFRLLLTANMLFTFAVLFAIHEDAPDARRCLVAGALCIAADWASVARGYYLARIRKH